ncbi:MAG: hypothetical protein H0T45_08930 [Pyrinomonadaceae bacterium]|nr:hypothetical protein [Pyrinomonadaceae bacterium]MDQ3133814.1 hypothetical protein [Acidobacteriota bacterium]
MSTKAESAELILKLYDLRREEKMRQARQWMEQFNPESAEDIVNAVMGEHSAFYRMAVSYWDMAASLVNNGAIDEQMFNDANLEHVFYFAKIEPYLAEMREKFVAPTMFRHLEELIMRRPEAAQQLADMRERSRRIAAMRAKAEASKQKAVSGKQ